MSKHRHRPVRREIRGFVGPIEGARRQDRRAHGNVTFVWHCKCGATKKANINGQWAEVGRWIAPEPQRRDR
jgi:hypothetical protein